MQLTQIQRWANYLTVIFGFVGLFIGFNLRDSALNATSIYINTQAGIQATYPRNWLIDQTGTYVFRVRDMAQIGFKTSIQVAVQPVSSDNSERNALDALALSRWQPFAGYAITSSEPYVLPNETPAIWVTSAFVDTQIDPFLQGIPTSVASIDVISIKRGQAIIITFLTDAQFYDENLPIFQQFLNDLEF
jgi:hypothetical protein